MSFPRLELSPTSIDWRSAAPFLGAAVAFGILFRDPAVTLMRDWWRDPDAGHGLLLGPLAIVLAWRSRPPPRSVPQPAIGIAILCCAVGLRYLSELAQELFTMRLSLWLALMGLVVFVRGAAQLARWWLPALLLLLSIPLPQVLTGTLALPLQLRASRLGAALLEWRHVPVLLSGNVIHLPGQSLFVTEACSGLRSLTALLSLGLLIAGFWLRTPPARVFLVLAAIPVAIALNGLRIFLTGFLVFFVDPSLGDGVMHYTEGWVMFVAAFAILGIAAWVVARLETVVRPRQVAR